MNFVSGKIYATVVLLVVCSAGPALCADQIVLNNGDTLTGAIVDRSERGVVLKHPALGTIAIGHDRIKQVKDGKQNAELVPQAQPQPDQNSPKKQDAATQAEAEAAAEAAQPDSDKIKGEAEQAAATQPTSLLNKFLTEWDSRLTLGLNGAGGNTDRQNYYVKLGTKYEDGRERWTINTQWFYGIASGEVTQNQFDSKLTKDWLQKDSPWFFFIKANYRYDAKRNWENRTSGFGGGGYTLAKTDDVELNTRIGFGGTYEFGNINEFTPEALFGGSVVKWQINDRSAISGETTYYPSLQESANFRIESSLEWTYKLDLATGQSLKVGLENEYDSNTPQDTGNNDLRYYGAVVLNF